MEIINRSGLPLETITALDKLGREHLVIVAKATWRFDIDGRPPAPAESPRPIAHTDVFLGEPGLSAPLYEADLVRRKQRCDVLLDATAHTPDGREVTELDVGMRVGAAAKQFLVIGDRTWKKGALGVTPTRPQPFSSMRLHYGRAFGGSPPRRSAKGGVDEQDTYFPNPIGVGYFPDASADAIDRMPLPNTEDFTDRITSPSAQVRPLGFGPIGRHWDPRRRYAGTYDAHWRENVFPFLPDDFDDAFFQAAPPDQQIDFPQGGEAVTLRHLVAGRPLVGFELPKPELIVKVLHSSQRATELATVVDTLFIEPDAQLFTMVYRASIPLDRQSVFGVKIVAAGPICKKWWSSKVYGTDDCGCGGDSANDAAPEGDAADAQAPQDGDDGAGRA